MTFVGKVLRGGFGASQLCRRLVLQLVEILQGDATLDAAHREALTVMER